MKSFVKLLFATAALALLLPTASWANHSDDYRRVRPRSDRHHSARHQSPRHRTAFSVGYSRHGGVYFSFGYSRGGRYYRSRARRYNRHRYRHDHRYADHDYHHDDNYVYADNYGRRHRRGRY